MDHRVALGLNWELHQRWRRLVMMVLYLDTLRLLKDNLRRKLGQLNVTQGIRQGSGVDLLGLLVLERHALLIEVLGIDIL